MNKKDCAVCKLEDLRKKKGRSLKRKALVGNVAPICLAMSKVCEILKGFDNEAQMRILNAALVLSAHRPIADANASVKKDGSETPKKVGGKR